MSAPAAYVVDAEVSHRRTRPFDYAFTHRTTSWLVDAAEPNAAFTGWRRLVLRIRSEDHFGRREGDLLTKVRRYLAENDLSWTAHTVKVLANARTAGYVFDPLTTYFVFAADGTLEGILAEVHNTYGEQHCYPLSADTARRGDTVGKEFYVSPFFAVEGRYDIRARLDDEQVAVSISLTQGDEKVFTGAIHGRLAPATRSTVTRAFLRNPLASQRVAALIRFHGIRLWLRRLPIVPRRPHPAPRGMS